MKTSKFFVLFSNLFLSLFLFSCNESTPPEPDLNSESNATIGQKLNKGDDPILDQLEYGTKRETEYVLHHYIANSEFGIWPTEYRQYAGSSGDQTRITKLNELKSKWGFNYIAAHIGDAQNITAIFNAGYPRTTNFIAVISVNQSGRDVVANYGNGLLPSDYFWAYYTDEPYSGQSITQYDFKSFRNYVKQLRPNSLLGFGETNVYTTNRFTHNPYFWYGTYYTNYNPASVDFVMCTVYWDYYKRNDQRPIWDELQTKYNNIYARTWISANLDGGEFSNLLGYCRDHGYAPWFNQVQDGYDYNDQMIASYCHAAWLEGFLNRYDTQYEVWYHCPLNHTHDPNAPWECMWVEDARINQGIVQR